MPEEELRRDRIHGGMAAPTPYGATIAPQRDPGMMPTITRHRYVELTRLANEIVEILMKEGLQRHEGCIFREIAERLWNM